jgi:hypothetical protein
VVDFVAEVLLSGLEERDLWRTFAESRPTVEFHWAIQVSVCHEQRGIADLLLLVDGKEAIVIENKIGAAVREHRKSAIASTDLDVASRQMPVADGNQLRTYGNWLALHCQDPLWPGALVLLTHYSEAPADFSGPAYGDYGVPILCVCRWGAIWRWAKKLGAQTAPDHEAAAQSMAAKLCNEFAQFLEDENMTADYVTFHDLAALEVYVRSADRLEASFEVMRVAVRQVIGELRTREKKDVVYEGEGGLVWD